MSGENSDIIVAERNGVICGMVCVDYVNKPETPYSKARSFYHVQEIAVDANHRRQGVAKELLEFMITDAKKRKLSNTAVRLHFLSLISPLYFCYYIYFFQS